MFEIEIGDLLHLKIKDLRGYRVGKSKKRKYITRIGYNHKTIHLGSFEDFYTASLIYWIVKLEIRPNYLIYKNKMGIYGIFICNEYFIGNTSKKLVKSFRKELIKANFDFDLWIEGNDNYEQFPIAV